MFGNFHTVEFVDQNMEGQLDGLNAFVPFGCNVRHANCKILVQVELLKVLKDM